MTVRSDSNRATSTLSPQWQVYPQIVDWTGTRISVVPNTCPKAIGSAVLQYLHLRINASANA